LPGHDEIGTVDAIERRMTSLDNPNPFEKGSSMPNDLLQPPAEPTAERQAGVRQPRSSRRLPRRAKLVGVSIAAVSTLFAVGAQPAFASWQAAYTWTSATLRDCYHPSKAAQPGTTCTAKTLMPSNTNLHIICQHAGETIDGDPVWDYVDTPYGQGYVTDAYVHTGYANWIPGVDVCNY
jgi:hypothetical protein